MVRQGDVLLVPVEAIPKGLKKVPLDTDGALVLAEGEATGHRHCVVEGEATLLATDLEEIRGRFLQVEAECQVVHDEHETLTLPPGLYEVRRQREYTPESERYVAD